MNQQARVIWEALEFRIPVILEAVQPLGEDQLHWQPPNGANSSAR